METLFEWKWMFVVVGVFAFRYELFQYPRDTSFLCGGGKEVEEGEHFLKSCFELHTISFMYFRNFFVSLF